MKKFGTLLVLLSLVTFSLVGCKPAEEPVTPPAEPTVTTPDETATGETTPPVDTPADENATPPAGDM